MRYLYLLFFFSFTLASFAQAKATGMKKSIDGRVLDEETKEPIAFASVRLLLQADSMYIKGTATDENGRFNISSVKTGDYIVEISFLGYKSHIKNISISSKNPGFAFGDVLMQENTVELEAAIVEAQVPDIVVKGDTIEYNAGAYSSDESDMLQDMIKNIPGIEIDNNGNITANGKPIKKILVDGKEFFGNDIPMALANLPANMVNKLQLYKEESDEAKVTGFKDKNPDQVLNLVVKEELKQSIFGDVRAGYGSDDKYAHKAVINYMRNNNQLSFVGDINNVSDNEYYMGRDNGINKNKNAGVNAYLNTSEKLKIGGSVRFSNNENQMETKTNTETFLSTGNRFSKQESSSWNRQNNFNAGLNLQWKPDSLTTIYARSYISFNDAKNEQNSTNMSYVAAHDTTSGYSLSHSKGNGYSVNNFFTIGRKLNNKGRTVSLSLNNSLRKDDSKGTSYSFTEYSGSTEDKIIDQRSDTDNKTNNYSLSMSYVEPLGKDYRLQLAYSISNNKSTRLRDVWIQDDAGNYTLIDSAYTRNTDNTYLNQNISLNFQATKEKYNYTIGFSVDPSYSKSKVTLGDSIIDNLNQHVVNFSPNINLSYTPNDHSTFDFSYSGSTSQPSNSQLSADTVIVNALSKHYGNPDLKPSYSNNINMYYQKSNYETGRFMMISGGFGYIFNNIVNYTLIDEEGNTTNTYKNVSGNLNANVNTMFDFPFKKRKFILTNNAYANYYKNIGFTNGDKAVTNNVVLSEMVTGRFRSDKFETSLRAGITYNMTRNNLNNEYDRNTTNYTLMHFAQLKLPYDFMIQSNLNFSYYSGYGDDFNKSEVLWNASVSKQFLKKKRGTLRIQFYDILNDRNTLSRTVTSNYVSDSRTNTVNQYFLVNFSYKFNIIRSKGKTSTDEEDVNGGMYYY